MMSTNNPLRENDLGIKLQHKLFDFCTQVPQMLNFRGQRLPDVNFPQQVYLYTVSDP